jgi:hypothetical protein
MNQKGVIYIILSAILLYIYYRRRDLAIFVGFIVVVVGTLILGKGGDAREGFGFGGGGGIDKECAKMGFKPPKIDNKDINGSLEKAMKNIKTVAAKYWKNGDINGIITGDEKLSNSLSVIKTYITNPANVSTEDQTMIEDIYKTAYELYEKFILQKLTDADKSKFIKDKILVRLNKDIKNSTSAMDVIDKIKKSDEMKDADNDVKKLLQYLVCLFKQWIVIFKAIKKAMADAGGGKKKKKPADEDEEGGGGGEDEDEKPKKKATKKKKPADNEEEEGSGGEGEDEEDEKPKKKKKTKKKPADDDDDE